VSEGEMDSISDILYELPEPAVGVLPGIDLDLALPSHGIASGGRFDAQLVITNRNNEEVAISTGQPLHAVIVLPGTRSVVGAYTGAVAGTGRHLRLGPGAADSLVVIVVAWGRGSIVHQPLHHHDDLRPGTYGAIVSMPVYDPLHKSQPQQAWSGEIRIEVTAGTA
jgi:hypothetical protein